MQNCLHDPMVVWLEVEEDEVVFDLDIETAIVIDSRDRDYYDGNYIVTPKAYSSTILETADKIMRDDVTVLEIPYYEVSNLSGGYTVNIAEEV